MRPNILVITSHDSGRHLACYGAGVATPAIDSFAASGVKFTRMFSVAPICSPSRGALLTGTFPQRNGLMGLAGGQWAWELNDYHRHLSHVARTAGYATHLFGHQHDTDFVERLGFDELHAYLSPHDRSPAKNAPAIAEAFAAFCRERPSDPPFYAQMGFFETHTPHDFGGAVADDPADVEIPPFTCADDQTVRQAVAALNGATRQLDRAIGITLQALRDCGIERDTLVLFNTDHGPELPRGKWTMLDGGLGIASILRYPAGGVSHGRTCNGLFSNIDFLPTLADLTGLNIPHNCDGLSYANSARDAQSTLVNDAIYALSVGSEYAVRTNRYKLIRRFQGERVPSRAHGPDGRPLLMPTLRLFDLSIDPLELNNLADDPAHATALHEMDSRLWRWLESVQDPILRGPVPTPYYRTAIAAYHQWQQQPESHSR
ncbi:sulfatase [soil metagenome]